MVVMSSKQKVRAEVEILLPAVTRDVRWVRDTEASPQFITFVPRCYFLDSETGHSKVERRCQVRPKSIAVEVSTIENVPGSIDRFAYCVLRGMVPFFDNGPIQFVDGNPVRREVSSLVIRAIREDRGPFALRSLSTNWMGPLSKNGTIPRSTQ